MCLVQGVKLTSTFLYEKTMGDYLERNSCTPYNFLWRASHGPRHHHWFHHRAAYVAGINSVSVGQGAAVNMGIGTRYIQLWFEESGSDGTHHVRVGIAPDREALSGAIGRETLAQCGHFRAGRSDRGSSPCSRP